MVEWLFGDSNIKRENEKPVDVISGFWSATGFVGMLIYHAHCPELIGRIFL